MPNSASFEMKSSPFMRSICCLPGFDASSIACLEKEPVVIKTPFSISVVSDPLKSLISEEPTVP